MVIPGPLISHISDQSLSREQTAPDNTTEEVEQPKTPIRVQREQLPTKNVRVKGEWLRKRMGVDQNPPPG